MNNKGLLGFFAGVVLTGLFACANNWATNKQWEDQAVNRGYGYFSWNVYDKLNWLGHQPLTFHWHDRISQAKSNKDMELFRPKQKPSIEIPLKKKKNNYEINPRKVVIL